MLHFLETAPTEAPANDFITLLMTFLPMIAIFGVMYFILMRPEKKRKKEAEEMRAALKVGDEVITIGGICGTVVNVKEDRFVMEVGADQVRLEFTKWALSSNETAAAAAREKAKKQQEEIAKARAAKKAAKK